MLTAPDYLLLRGHEAYTARLILAIAAVARSILVEAPESKEHNIPRLRWAREASRDPGTQLPVLAWPVLVDPDFRTALEGEAAKVPAPVEPDPKEPVDPAEPGLPGVPDQEVPLPLIQQAFTTVDDAVLEAAIAALVDGLVREIPGGRR